MKISYKMYADEQANEYYIKQIISHPPLEQLEDRDEVKRKYYVLKVIDQKLYVYQYTQKTDDHDDDIREFVAFRNVFDRKMHFVDKENLDKLKELKNHLSNLEAEHK